VGSGSVGSIGIDRVGQLLGEKWRLTGRLGEGGMGAVYVARHERNGKRVAIKVLHGLDPVDADALARFHREGYIANLIDSPHVVSVLDDDFTPEGTPYLVMELLEGDNLDERAVAAGGVLPPEDVVRWADTLLEVLASAHALGIVHRDLKPSNLFVNTRGVLKVLDFGLATLRGGGGGGRRITTDQTPTMGTLGFMPPEQARGEWDRVDARSDLWAVGATMFSLLAGQDVHEAANLAQLYMLTMTEPPRTLRSVAPRLPEALAEVVDRALRFEPTDRFATASEMRAALRRAARSAGLVRGSSDSAFEIADDPTLDADSVPAGVGPPSARISVPFITIAGDAKTAQLPARPAATRSTESALTLASPKAAADRNKRLLLFTIAALTLVTLGVGYLYLARAREDQGTPNATNATPQTSSTATPEETHAERTAVVAPNVTPTIEPTNPPATVSASAPPTAARPRGSARAIPPATSSAAPPVGASGTAPPPISSKPDLDLRR
jgi:serine/threonine-protein kinase